MRQGCSQCDDSFSGSLTKSEKQACIDNFKNWFNDELKKEVEEGKTTASKKRKAWKKELKNVREDYERHMNKPNLAKFDKDNDNCITFKEFALEHYKDYVDAIVLLI